MTTRSTRRTLLRTSVRGGAGAGLFGALGMHDASGSRMQDVQPVREATTPTWRFIVHGFHDPYAGEILQPAEQEPGTRYVGADIEIHNDSDAPLHFGIGQIRLLDAEGTERTYTGVVGSDPRLVDINMLPGERTRGWTWFEIREDLQAVGLVFIPQAPRLSVSVGDDTGE